MITLADLIARFGETEITRRTGRGSGPIDQAMIDKAIADAVAEIEMYLASRYTLPLVPTPVAIARLACDIARYRLFEDGPTEDIRLRYEDAVTVLRGIASGLISIGPEAAPVEPPPGAVYVSAPPRVFDEDTLRDY